MNEGQQASGAQTGMPAHRRRATIGLALGAGTGPELGAVFRQMVDFFGGRYAIDVELCQSERLYRTYHSVSGSGSAADAAAVSRQARNDADHYVGFCRQLAAAGVAALFRTAINAQSLYQVRQQLQAVKIERLKAGALDLLLVRDQAQGFYSGENTFDAERQILTRNCSFDRHLTAAILEFGIRRARALWGEGGIGRVVMAYKFHLLDGVFSAWARQWSAEHGIEIEVFQPDTVNRNLIHGELKGRVLCIGANEWADIMHVVLLHLMGLGPQESRCTQNVYLHPGLAGLTEYQTVHGSADSLAGRGLVNPFATMRAAAALLENHAGCAGAAILLEDALAHLTRAGILTPDLGGGSSTEEVVAAALQQMRQQDGVAQLRPPPQPRRKSALLLMDFQNDFHQQAQTLDAASAPPDLTERIVAAAESARGHALEVLFARFAGDEQFQKPNWRERDRRLDKRPKCLEGSEGADFHRVRPRAGERVFTKQAAFDAFLCVGFEEYLQQQGIEELIFAGLFCDVCIDATARTAFQKGYFVSVLSDGCASLHHAHTDTLAFMRRVYGARVLSCAEFTDALRHNESTAHVRLDH